ncbi:F-box protein SKIP24 [Platanthera guangdongensis]|uniref:F-box protein SKIP24 n=1 Tax=Platanthera guangdongensis TaxID=2320717 RepID=A0ABR2LKN9_9ASPA
MKLPLQFRFERSKARRVAARRRAILIAESNVAVCIKRLEELERRWREEGERMKAAVLELNNLERVRQASVALNVWQPVVVRGSQRQMVEQCTVPIASRLSDLQMEVNLCRQQIATNKKAHAELMKKLSESKDVLSSLKYSPLETNNSSEPGNCSGTKRKKLKSYSSESLLSLLFSSPGNILFTFLQSFTHACMKVHSCVNFEVLRVFGYASGRSYFIPLMHYIRA